MRWLALFLLPGSLYADSPVFHSVSPPGGERGAEMELIVHGERLGDAKGLLFYEPGIAVTDWKIKDEKTVLAKIKIAPDCALGENPVRVWTATGISEVRPFFVGPYPTVERSGSNHSPASAQKIPLNVTVSGAVDSEQSDFYAVECRKDQRLTVEVEGMRLGTVLFDPVLTLFDPQGKRIAENDDNSLLLQDPLVSLRIPADGVYRIEIRDSSYAGGNDYRYRMHAGTFPQPMAAYPAGGPAGKELNLDLLGDVMGTIHRKIGLPANGSATLPLFAEENGQIAPAANVIRISPFPNVLEVEPNNDIVHATPANTPLPVAFNGIIGEKGDVDYFKFQAKKDETYDFRVYARALRSPLDSVLTIFDAKGKQLGYNDDSGGPDSYLRLKMPADGDYYLAVSDQMHRGGPDYVYRVEVTLPAAAVAFSIPQIVRDSQERQTIVIPRGNQYATPLQIKRTDFDDDFTLVAQNLPAGVTMIADPVPAGADSIPVVFEAAADAPVDCRLVDLTARCNTKKEVHSGIEQPAGLVIAPPAQTVYRQIMLGKLAVAVTEEAPFKLHIVQPKAPLVQNGAMDLKVVAERKEGYRSAIEVSLAEKPPGIGAGTSVKIPEGQNEITLPLSAAGESKIAKWKIAAIGSGETAKGKVWVGSPFAEMEVAKPFVTGTFIRGSVTQGESEELVFKLTQATPFEGKAKLELLNLPGKVTAEPVEITSADQEARFKITADKTTTPGTKRDLFCRITIMKEGEPIVDSIGQGGVLRVAKAFAQAGSQTAAR